MSVSAQQSINAVGDSRYTGWDETAMNADMAAKGLTAGTATTQTGLPYPASPANTFNWDAATTAAFQELQPYYTKLLDMYKGDIALAKQQMDQDYERGLRVKSEQTATGISDIEAQKAERARKFNIALKDLDQTANTRGIYTSGIRTTDVANAAADEAAQKQLLQNQERDLTTGLQYYKEGADATRNAQLEKWGMLPVSSANNPTGQYAPSDTGVNTTGFDVNKYTPEPVQKQSALEKQQQLDAQAKATQDYDLAMAKWQASINQINSVQ